MRILVTGANGFIGKNLIAGLENKGYIDIYKCNKDTKENELRFYLKNCDYIYHLAGVNRPKNNNEYMEENYGFTKKILDELIENDNRPKILFASSIQVKNESLYGKSKKAAEKILLEYKNNVDENVIIYRLSNVFGKWSKPNYNSVIATFANNISRNEEIFISNPKKTLDLIYIDDVIEEFINMVEDKMNYKEDIHYVKKVYRVNIENIANLLYSFKNSRENLHVPNVQDEFEKKLYSTYLSYIPEDKFKYDIKTNVDERGSFTELFKTQERGQFSVNILKPGVIKGNHWHNTKNEKFVVVHGKGIIRFRKINSNEIIEYNVNGDDIKIIDIPVGYTHNIENVGKTDMITVIWSNECYDPNNPDTYYMEV